MKKVLVVCMAFVVSLSFTNKTNAQVKIGVFDEQQILPFMPGIQKVDTILNNYVSDSLKPQYDWELSELKRKDSTFKKDSATMNPSLREIMRNEITQSTYKIVNWQQYQQQKLQAKQQELLAPYEDKIYAALKEVIAEQKYTVVLKPDAVLIAEKSEDIPLRVLAKLNIPLPKDIQDQIKALGITTSGATSGGTGTKPAAKPAQPKH